MYACCRQNVRCNQEVTATLAQCGHRVSWICGADDPRTTAAPCLHCCLDAWDTALRDEGRPQLPEQSELLDHALKWLPSELEVERVAAVAAAPVHAMSEAALRIMQAYRDHLHACSESGAPVEEMQASIPPRLDDMSNFDVVFRPILAGHPLSFPMKATPYGQGVALRCVTVANLQRIQPDDSGSVEVLLGLAFRHKALEDTPPFLGRHSGSKSKKAAKANRMAMQLQGAGLDHVVPADSTAEHALRIYWMAGAAVPLASVVLRVHRPCGICLEHKLGREGCQCSQGHFLCWDCFEMLLDSAKQPDVPQRMVRPRETTFTSGRWRCGSTYYSIYTMHCPN